MNETATTLKDMLPFIIPLIVVQLVLIVIAILINIIGPIVYLAFGRRETAVERYTD